MNQCDTILAMLRANPDGITALDALHWAGSARLAARISELRERGYIITTYTVRRGNANVGLYRLREPEPMKAIPYHWRQPRTCARVGCEQEFKPRTKGSKYCRSACRVAAHRERTKA